MLTEVLLCTLAASVTSFVTFIIRPATHDRRVGLMGAPIIPALYGPVGAVCAIAACALLEDSSTRLQAAVLVNTLIVAHLW